MYPTCNKLIPSKVCPIILLRVAKCYLVRDMVKSAWVWIARRSVWLWKTQLYYLEKLIIFRRYFLGFSMHKRYLLCKINRLVNNGGRAHENLDLALNCFISITKVWAASRTYILLSNVNVIMLCEFWNGDSEESLHLVGRDYPTLENQLEIHSRLKKQVFEETVCTYDTKSSI